jgi:hypothetical protein
VRIKDGVRELSLPRHPLFNDIAQDSFNLARQAAGSGPPTTATGGERRSQRITQKAHAQSVDGRPVKAEQLRCALCLLAPHGAIAQRAKHPGNLDLAFGDRSRFAHDVPVSALLACSTETALAIARFSETQRRPLARKQHPAKVLQSAEICSNSTT